MTRLNAPLTSEGRRRLCERVDAGRAICHVAAEAGIARQTLGSGTRGGSWRARPGCRTAPVGQAPARTRPRHDRSRHRHRHGSRRDNARRHSRSRGRQECRRGAGDRATRPASPRRSRAHRAAEAPVASSRDPRRRWWERLPCQIPGIDRGGVVLSRRSRRRDPAPGAAMTFTKPVLQSTLGRETPGRKTQVHRRGVADRSAHPVPDPTATSPLQSRPTEDANHPRATPARSRPIGQRGGA